MIGIDASNKTKYSLLFNKIISVIYLGCMSVVWNFKYFLQFWNDELGEWVGRRALVRIKQTTFFYSTQRHWRLVSLYSI